MLFFFIALAFFSLKIFAQTTPEDSAFFARKINNTVSLYYQSLLDQSQLYNGKKYAGYPFTFSEGTPFFLSDKLQQGSIKYNGLIFENINLMYDELSNAIIMQDENHRIQLLNEKISWFTIAGFRFICFINDGKNNAAPETGFYNVLYEGNISVLKKETKKIREILAFSGDDKTHVIDTKANYYFKKNNEFTAINNQNELIDFFSDRKKEVKHFIKTSKLNFKKDPDNELAKVAAYFEKSTK